jgi:hypothetical protein
MPPLRRAATVMPARRAAFASADAFRFSPLIDCHAAVDYCRLRHMPISMAIAFASTLLSAFAFRPLRLLPPRFHIQFQA